MNTIKHSTMDIKFDLLKLISWVSIVLLFLPKINFFSIEGQTAGLRIDDIVILLLAFIIISINCYYKSFKASEIEIILFCFIIFGILSNVINILLFKQSNFLYSIRIIEYTLFFYTGHFTKRYFSIYKIYSYYLYITLVIFLLQKLEIIGGFTSLGYSPSVAGRVIGLTGGPWEVGLILAYSLCIFLYSRKEEDTKVLTKGLYIVVIFVAVLITGARLPTLAVLIIGCHWLYNIINNKLLLITTTFVFGLLFIFTLSQIENPVLARSENLFSYSNINQFVTYFSSTVPDKSFVDFPDVPADEDADMSWLYRVAKWSYAIKFWVYSPHSYFIGLGPGIWGLALDGGWIRMFTEYGIFGISIFFLFLRKAASINLTSKMLVIAFSVNMFMIDIYIAYKCMAFFLFTVGFFYEKKSSFNSRAND